MKKTDKLLSLIIISGIIISFFTACATSKYVYVQQDKYTPQFPARDYRDYKGKTILLNSIANKSQNTTMFYYYSNDKKVCYEGSPSLESYMWYCFQKAFMYIGVIVQEPQGTPFTPTVVPEGMIMMELEFTTFTDTKLVFNINLFKGNRIIYKKTFPITMQPCTNPDPLSLEKNAYKMMDEAFTSVLSDSGFRESFLK